MDKLNINSKMVLNNGIQMPVIGFGTYLSKDGEEVTNAVKWALSAGYRLIDTAMTYDNEKGVGEGVRESGVKEKKFLLLQNFGTATKVMKAHCKRSILL